MGSRAASTATYHVALAYEAAMLIIVDADVSALVGKEKKMRVKAFFGAD